MGIGDFEDNDYPNLTPKKKEPGKKAIKETS